jgi:hypothetical protein
MRGFSRPSRVSSLRSREPPIAIAVAPGRARARPLVTAGPDHSLHIGLHEDPRHGLRQAAREISVVGLSRGASISAILSSGIGSSWGSG